MPRTHHSAIKAAVAARYGPLLSDPLNPLAEEVGKAVAAEVGGLIRIGGARAPSARQRVSKPMLMKRNWLPTSPWLSRRP